MGKKKTTKKSLAETEIRMIPVEKLDFDRRNPRLWGIRQEDMATEEDMLRVLWREMAVDEIAMSIIAAGRFFQHEPLFAVEADNGRFTVIEGNRRLAAVRLLLDRNLRTAVGATSLPEISQELRDHLRELPVGITTRLDAWQYIGFKHVNGPRPWDAYSKAVYVARLHDEERIPLEEIASQIGDRHSTVKRLYRGLKALEQAQQAQVFDLEDRWNRRFAFSHLYTALDYPGFQRFLGIKEATSYKKNPVPKSRVKNLGEVCIWLYGSESTNRKPLVRTQNPDLRRLEEALQDDRGIDALRAGLPLEVAVEAAKGDEAIFREALIQAKVHLSKAHGTCVTGDDGKSDTFELAEDIYRLAGKLLDAMEENRSASRKRGRGTRRK
ncbi:MAG: ParB N-terminal domain-containing protein [Planctomycetes bacterium]|nr:ParB N-terminal domain-containing protein [Planctomycetota bacterium]